MRKSNFSLDLDWTKETEFSLDGESEILEVDSLDRQKYAEYLYFYLKEQGNKNTVVNLNAEWGAGKTYFIKRLYASLNKHHPCIYIDAWKQDFSDDAFLTLFSSLINQIEYYSGNLDRKLIRASESIGRFTKGIVPEVISGLLKKYAGLEDISDIAKTASTLMLEQHNEKLKAIVKLKKELSFWAELSFKKGYNSPIFIFIDELDRCRPDYAISLLEIVKHIFSVEKFIFIISTDTEQLQHSIKRIYGENFDASLYLNRFFHRRFSLHAPDFDTLISLQLEERIGHSYDSLRKKLFPINNWIDFKKTYISLLNISKPNIRDTLKITDRFCDIINKNDKNINYLLLLFLLLSYEIDKDVFDSFIHSSGGSDSIKELLKNARKMQHFSRGTMKLIIDSSKENTDVHSVYVRNHVSTDNRIAPQSKDINSVVFLTLLKSHLLRIERVNKFLLADNIENIITSEEYSYSGADKEDFDIQYYSIINGNKKPFCTLKNYIDYVELAISFD
ncbi:NTPase [Pectobacterium carotovorum subsp. carotovorum]|nr:NTPase [Pectobacterium carotovorum subsp. carotovorum]